MRLMGCRIPSGSRHRWLSNLLASEPREVASVKHGAHCPSDWAGGRCRRNPRNPGGFWQPRRTCQGHSCERPPAWVWQCWRDDDDDDDEAQFIMHP